MKSRIIFFFLLGVGCFNPLVAQLHGFVRGVSLSDTVPLNGAKVKVLRAKKATFTDSDGKFEIYLGKQFPDTLVILSSGYFPDTILLSEKDRFGAITAVLFSDNLKPEVLVERRCKCNRCGFWGKENTALGIGRRVYAVSIRKRALS